MDPTDRAILTHIQRWSTSRHPYATAERLRGALGGSIAAIAVRCQALRAQELLTTQPGQGWALTPAGRIALVAAQFEEDTMSEPTSYVEANALLALQRDDTVHAEQLLESLSISELAKLSNLASDLSWRCHLTRRAKLNHSTTAASAATETEAP